jgi:hypothetical protein
LRLLDAIGQSRQRHGHVGSPRTHVRVVCAQC